MRHLYRRTGHLRSSPSSGLPESEPYEGTVVGDCFFASYFTPVGPCAYSHDDHTVDSFCPYPGGRWHGDMAFVDDLFLPHKVRPSFLLFAYFAGFVALPCRRVGVCFKEPHLRLILWLVESGFPRIPHDYVFTAHQGGLVLRYCFE